ncbi:host attachment family protein [Pseudoroseicyclus aestuarii]|uniref:Protein required for attachment to host cells n=1 Tax=Pseudoroseicyclus aestuarii TaxID=1795041 RepID=A0A318SQ89_9RHOB|nr:host attachment family protein [Pseudoroseicyclus aestuarii]PYE84040.1 protein required for attachment to host cells [Pseudoroseicyclus aestuarii]
MAALETGTWVLVADGEKALFLRNMGDAQDPNLEVVRKTEQEDPPNRDQVTDAPGSMADGGPMQRSSLEQTDFHQLAKERFAEDLADILYRQAHRGKIERLVIVAPPKVLGALRPHLHKEVAALVIAEIDKTLTNHPVIEIEGALKAELG